jgi:hypothetical protein
MNGTNCTKNKRGKLNVYDLHRVTNRLADVNGDKQKIYPPKMLAIAPICPAGSQLSLG